MSVSGHRCWWRWGLPVLAFVLVFVGMQFDAGWYRQPIARIQTVQTTQVAHPVDNFQNHDRVVTQKLQAVLLNTAKQGQRLTLHNTYSASGAEDAPLAPGNQVFLAHAGRRYTISNIKRDAILMALAAATLVLLGLIVGRHLWLTLVSITANALLFIVALHVEIASHQTLAFLLFSAVAIGFAVITTVFVVGVKPLAAVVASATIGATALGVALGYGIFVWTNYRDLHLETVKYVTQAPQLLFFVQIIIGSLGAVLDESSDIAVAIFQLHDGGKARFHAGMAIGRNVMGPLITVLFMIFIAETFAESVLWLRNGNSISQTVVWVMGLGFAQSLISAFGIVLAIPLTSGLAALAARRTRRLR
ncbi:YibE/F family protein [Lacticaseibacillus baoqingensis]|uniref:YibE/F family protein n=1 Tax=Lacticaseibacillus baoqingensis TaxID=2486013 RepID=A0ABW4E8Y8_9LACO|nr:YibE/F family protein [Lacticaseibacillus baoqingensis]